MKNRFCGWVFLTLAVVVCGGCGESSGLPTVPVTGTVTIGGEPVEGATVSFNPTQGAGQSAVGVTDASGKYTLITRGQSGALVGYYTVTITKFQNPPEQLNAVPSTIDYADPHLDEYGPDYNERKEQYESQGTTTNLLPEQYASPTTSGFAAEVNEGGGTFDFAMEGVEAKPEATKQTTAGKGEDAQKEQ